MDVNFWLGVVVFAAATVGGVTAFLRSMFRESEERADRRGEAMDRRFDALSQEMRENFTHRDVFKAEMRRVDDALHVHDRAIGALEARHVLSNGNGRLPPGGLS